jgi:tetratricopeptide (TPR) repeat protein
VRKAFYELGALAARPATFDVAAARAVAGANEAALGRLIDANLLEKDAEERLALHPVVADVARVKTSGTARKRQEKYYRDLVDGNRKNWQQIEDAYDQARYALEQLPESDKRIVPWVWALRVYWNVRGLGQEHLRWAEQALVVAERQGDIKTQGTLRNNIGGVYSDLSDQQKALAYYEQALPLLRQVGDKGGEATTLNNIGGVYSALGDKQKALAH